MALSRPKLIVFLIIIAGRIYKKEKYIQQPEYITTNSHHYQSSENYPIYSDDYSGNMHRRNGLEFRSFVPVHHFLKNQNRLEQLRIQRELKLQKLKKQKMLRKHKAAGELSNKKKRQKVVLPKNSTEPNSNGLNNGLNNSLNGSNNQKNVYPDPLDKYDQFLRQKVLYSDSPADPDLGLQAEGDNTAMVRK